MKSRRGSSLWGSPLGGASMVNQYKAGDIVHPVGVGCDHNFIGVVREACVKTNKVLVAWGGGSLSQHDPDELMPFAASNVKMASRRASRPFAGKSKVAAVEEEIETEIGHLAFERAKQLLYKANDSFKEFASDYANRKASWGVPKDDCDDIEKLYYSQCMKELAKQAEKKAKTGKVAADPNTDPQFAGNPETHGIDQPRGGGFSIMQDLQDDLHTESIEQAKEGVKMAANADGSIAVPSKFLEGRDDLESVSIFIDRDGNVETRIVKDGAKSVKKLGSSDDWRGTWHNGVKKVLQLSTGNDREFDKWVFDTFSVSKSKTSSLRSRRAMYWSAPSRVYRMTRKEIADNTSTCPKCGQSMNADKFTRSEKLLICPDCGFKIPTGSVVQNIEGLVSRRKAGKVALDMSNIHVDIAHKVLNALGRIPGAKAEHYENGREHGFFIKKGNKGVAFSEYRSGMDIVVYFGDADQFDPEDGFLPSDEIGRRAKFFSPEDIEKSVKFIKGALR